ncbi:TetR/AcrR family transcriptional regulator [Bacillus haynesii]|uniref:TetR/AcrR family transcriptional regulator n=1 Tax=Bacillus haynesii TaxID=1925021 RepID=UPI002DB9D00B|nr:TetR/AcrR family transcriptional regulator [Bacillus haynesii]MEC1561962.1 TetR/AcrR family transcriptional regulator [Bacillus haynesii]
MGRRKEFVREEALRSAMRTFWSKGYDGTSIPDLMHSMCISRSSLYETFGDKQSLLNEAVKYYSELVGEKKRGILANAKSAKQGLTDYFRYHTEAALAENGPGGCLITNLSIFYDYLGDETKTLIEERIETLEEAFYNLLEKGKENGELASTVNSRKTARLLLAMNHGMNVLARVKGNSCIMKDISESIPHLLT